MLSFKIRCQSSCIALSIIVSGCKAYRPDKGLHENFVTKRAERETNTPKVDPATTTKTNTQTSSKGGKTTTKAGIPTGPGKTTTPAEDPKAMLGTTFRVSSLGLHTGVELYDRTSLLVQTEGEADQSRPNYKLGEVLKIEKNKTYTIIVRLYLADKVVFSNETCNLNNSFVAQERQNVFSIPICVPPTSK
ncbi:MAG: hypothetical protein H7318_01215 [Oligoflexus sp.]|nr:hypothetical protein [Oligoflexus sp.]